MVRATRPKGRHAFKIIAQQDQRDRNGQFYNTVVPKTLQKHSEGYKTKATGQFVNIIKEFMKKIYICS